MEDSKSTNPTRREFIKSSTRIAATSALAGIVLPHVHAAENNTIRVALCGCGGRGTGAAQDALDVKNGPIKLVAMGDVFENRLKDSYRGLKRKYGDKIDVPEDRKFVGFDAYKNVVDSLDGDDVVIFATPPAFRWVHFTYAIEKGINVFMEKPVTVDGPTTRRMLKLGEKSVEKNMKVGVGLMVRHCRARQALYERIQNGEIGDITMMRAYRMAGPMVGFAGPNPGRINDFMYQIQKFHSFIWASGGTFSDFYIHQVDENCWMKNAWPVKAQASGGRHFRDNAIDQNFDNYSVEYTFADGTKLFLYGRNMQGCHDEFASYVHGTKAAAVVSASAHHPGRCKIFKDHRIVRRGNEAWAFPQPEPNPYKMEWEDLIQAIREDLPYNEVKRGAEASLVTSMGRMAAHTGQIISYDDILNSKHEFAPGLNHVTEVSDPPVMKGADGKYPVPMPGQPGNRNREYGKA
ncbi:MAG TPA: Gfo/Idh/MocA family oxidoreductase [Verrucomicrobiales bacterium]|nr:Gfo/Idh/MocA family oxidoreductase [Verrucomicrobiales bacterium]HIL71914.1 Gfo/Idh/MocA family oxidoreductase [Verrucomicrobiota bacterium]